MRVKQRAVYAVWLAALPHVIEANHMSDPRLREAFEKAVYRIQASEQGPFWATNPAQKTELEFSADQAWLRTNAGKLHLAFRLIGYGYASDLRTPTPAKLAAAGNRLEYRRGDITEWYVNEARGVEQGFTLTRRPASAVEGQPLVIVLNVSGDLRPVLADGRDAVLLQSGKQTVLRYSGLRAWSAGGRRVPSRLEVREREIWVSRRRPPCYVSTGGRSNNYLDSASRIGRIRWSIRGLLR